MARARRGFSLTELLVVAAVVMVLGAMAAGAVSAATSNQKKLLTRTLLAKLDVPVAAQYASYAGRNVVASSGTARGIALRAMAEGDLPDGWDDVAAIAARAEADLSPPQRAYMAVWQSLSDSDRQLVPQTNSGAECLFLVVMYGGLVDCLDCGSLRMDVGDQDADGMPEFLDAWDNPIGFVLWPRGLRLPADGSERFFSPVQPFDPVLPRSGDSKGGVMRPLIFSAGPDGEAGLNVDASPLVGSIAHRDNLTNFDEEAKR